MEKVAAALERVEAEMKRTQVNKATEFHLGQLKSKHAKLTRQLERLHSKTRDRGAPEHMVERQRMKLTAEELLEDMGKMALFQGSQCHTSALHLLLNGNRPERLQALCERAAHPTIEREAGVYMCKFDDDPEVKEAAFLAFSQLYHNVGEAERRARLCEHVLPFILECTDSLLSETNQSGKQHACLLAVRSLVPFCCVQSNDSRIRCLLEKLKDDPSYAFLQPSVAQGLQLLDGE